MRISGKLITVPEQEYNLYWITELRVLSLDPTKGSQIKATLRPYKLEGNDVVFAKGLDISLSIDDLTAYGEKHPGVEDVIDAVKAAISAAAKDAELI